MRALDMEMDMEVVKIKTSGRVTRPETIWFRKNKKGLPAVLCVSADISKAMPWIKGERVNLLASKSGTLFALVPATTGLLTMNVNGDNFIFNSMDLCATIRAKCMAAGKDVDEFKAWIADGRIYFAPRE